MRARVWPAVAVSFGALLLFSTLLAWLVSHEAARIHEHTRTAHQVYQKADDAISDIQANINKGALIEQSGFSSPDSAETRSRISELQLITQNDCATLINLIGASQRPQILALQQGLDEYWGSIQRGLSTARTQHGQQILFSELENQPGRVLDLAGRIDALNQGRLAREEQEIESQQTKLRHYAIAATLLLLLLECSIAVFSTAYMYRLDKISEAERQRAEKAEQELRRLSNQLVRVQEEERKTISRELHDEVGQILTGLRMELGTLSHYGPNEEFRQRLESVKRLAEEALRSVRNLALLVRPSMLDDLGLEPALHWQAKEFSRRCGVPVSVNIEGNLAHLPEPLRLCLYRAVQEAMTNCGKHADASHIRVMVKQDETRVTASVQDDGRGFDALLTTRGLGLMGMTERVRALQGRMSVASEPGSGTLISLELPARLDPSVSS
jgi:signal transduction histidine kinase